MVNARSGSRGSVASNPCNTGQLRGLGAYLMHPDVVAVTVSAVAVIAEQGFRTHLPQN